MFRNTLPEKLIFIISSSLLLILVFFLITRINQNIHIMEEHYHYNINNIQKLTNIRHDFTQTLLDLKKHLLKPTENVEKPLYLWSKIKKIIKQERFFKSQDIKSSPIFQKLDQSFKELESSLNIDTKIDNSDRIYNLLSLHEHIQSKLKAIQHQQYSAIDDDYQYIIGYTEQNFYLIIIGLSIFILVFFLILYRYLRVHKQLSNKISSLLNTLPIINKPVLPPRLNIIETIDTLGDNLNSFFKALTYTFNKIEKIANKLNDDICSQEAHFNHHLKTVFDNVINNMQILANINISANEQFVEILATTEKIVCENNHINATINQNEQLLQNEDILEDRYGQIFQGIVRRTEVISSKTSHILSNLELLKQFLEEQHILVNESLESMLQLNQDFHRLNPLSDLSDKVDSELCNYSVDLQSLLKDYVRS